MLAWALLAIATWTAAQTTSEPSSTSTPGSPFTFSESQTDESLTSTSGQTTTDQPASLPSGPVVAITFPGTNTKNQVFVGSLVAIESAQTTIVLACAPGASPSSCILEDEVTVTAAPTTLKFTYPYPNGVYTEVQDCAWSSTGGGVCTVAGIAPGVPDVSSYVTTVTAGATPYISEATTTSFAASEVHVVSVTVTAGATSGLNGATDSATDSTTIAESSASASATSTSARSSGSGTTTAAPNDAKALTPGVLGAGLMGLVAALL